MLINDDLIKEIKCIKNDFIAKAKHADEKQFTQLSEQFLQELYRYYGTSPEIDRLILKYFQMVLDIRLHRSIEVSLKP